MPVQLKKTTVVLSLSLSRTHTHNRPLPPPPHTHTHTHPPLLLLAQLAGLPFLQDALDEAGGCAQTAALFAQPARCCHVTTCVVYCCCAFCQTLSLSYSKNRCHAQICRKCVPGQSMSVLMKRDVVLSLSLSLSLTHTLTPAHTRTLLLLHPHYISGIHDY